MLGNLFNKLNFMAPKQEVKPKEQELTKRQLKKELFKVNENNRGNPYGLGIDSLINTMEGSKSAGFNIEF